MPAEQINEEGRIGSEITISPRTRDKILAKIAQEEYPGDILSYLAGKYEVNLSIKALGREIGLDPRSLVKVFDENGLPRLTPEEVSRRTLATLRQDPDFVAAQAEATSKAVKAVWRRPGYKEERSGRSRSQMLAFWQSDQSEERREAMTQGRTQKLAEDTEFRNSRAEIGRQNLAKSRNDPVFQGARIDGVRRFLERAWNDAEDEEYEEYRQKIRKRSSEVMHALRRRPNFVQIQTQATVEMLKDKWANDENYREMMTEMMRKIRLDPSYTERWRFHGIAGIRGDLGVWTLSAYEANYARILILEGVQFIMREVFELSVPQEYRDQFGIGERTAKILDFLSLDSEGNFIGHEIMASPEKGPIGWLRMQLLAEQYPEISLRLITESDYRKLEKTYKPIINSNPRFRGWETGKDNLRTDPEKFS